MALLTNGQLVQVEVNFGDNETKIVSGVDKTFYLNKTYRDPKIFYYATKVVNNSLIDSNLSVKAYNLTISCPPFTNIQTPIICNVAAVTLNDYLYIAVYFGDGDNRYFYLNDQTTTAVNLTNTYTKPGIYPVKALVTSNDFFKISPIKGLKIKKNISF